jgi:hypothetical protein
LSSRLWIAHQTNISHLQVTCTVYL